MNYPNALVAAILSASTLAPAQAVPVTFSFTGRVTWVSDGDGYLDGSISTGSTMFGHYSFEPGSLDSDPTDSRGAYASDDCVFVLNVGDYSITMPYVLVVVTDDFHGRDAYTVYTATAPVGTSSAYVAMFLSDPSGTAFSGTSQPLSPPDLSNFTMSYLRLIGDGYKFEVDADLTSLAPEPHACMLLSLGMIMALKRSIH